MIESITFKTDEYYGDTATEKLSEWSKNITKSRIISITMHDDGRVTAFYWSSK